MGLTGTIGGTLTSAGRGLADLMLPHQCVLCRRFAETTSLCAACWDGLAPIAAPICARCGLPLGHTLADPLCAACWAKPPKLAAIRGCFHYGGSVRDLVLAFKHGDRLQLTPFLTGLMTRLFLSLAQDDPLVVPVPLHRRRFYRRRYNQAAELARHLCATAGCGLFAPQSLVRRRATRSQGGLSRQQRRRNVAGAFAVPPAAITHLQGRPVLLVDDVMTTGATLTEAATRLQAAGSGAVSALVLARVTRPHEA